MPAMAPPDRREHSRYPVHARAQVLHDSRGWDVRLLDMSFTGACLAMDNEHPLREGDEIKLTVELEEVSSPDVSELLDHQPRKCLRLRGTMVYRDADYAGVEYCPLSEVDQVLLALLLSRPED
ncbi:PilZ domain-containing protein [Marinimicrobium locisalis]|uniref:PilZ domain-containing protein n=1 Tax=Marinimicrobium locisalis TaxID=546022 RepID=UPI00322140D3